MPRYSQSLTLPAPSLGTTNCHSSSPVFSSRQYTLPRSPMCRLSRGVSLFVPTNTLPPETVVLPYVWLPSLAAQRTFLVVAISISSLPRTNLPGSKLEAMPVSDENKFPLPSRDHTGQSSPITKAAIASGAGGVVVLPVALGLGGSSPPPVLQFVCVTMIAVAASRLTPPIRKNDFWFIILINVFV